MKIAKAQHLGFCYGVRRAIRMADELSGRGEGPICSLGPLIHNPQEVERLENTGIAAREPIEACAGFTTIIRTHGISREELRKAESLGIRLVDATCPYVKVPRRHIQSMCRQGRFVLLVGDPGHPEVRTLLSYGCEAMIVVSDPAGVPALPSDTPVGIVAQTTQVHEVVAGVAAAARARFTDVVEFDTICEDTARRQDEGRRLAQQVDMVVVVGGRNSANTGRLASICRAIQPRTIHIEHAGELGTFRPDGAATVGLISGASTPDWILSEVESRLRHPDESI